MTEGPLPLLMLVDEAFQMFRRHIRTIYPSVVAPVVIMIGALTFVQVHSMKGIMAISQGSEPSVGAIFGSCLPMAVFFFLYFLAWMATTNAMMAASMDVIEKRPPDMGRAWRFAVDPAVLGTLVLVGLASSLGALFCILPGIYLSLLFAFTQPIMVREKLRGSDAMGRSAVLMGKNPFDQFPHNPMIKLFVVWVVGGIVAYAAAFVVQLPAMLIQQGYIWRNASQGGPMDPMEMMEKLLWIQVPSAMLGAAIQVATGLYVVFMITLLSRGTLRRRAGTDLEQALDAITP